MFKRLSVEMSLTVLVLALRSHLSGRGGRGECCGVPGEWGWSGGCCPGLSRDTEQFTDPATLNSGDRCFMKRRIENCNPICLRLSKFGIDTLIKL